MADKTQKKSSGYYGSNKSTQKDMMRASRTGDPRARVRGGRKK